MKSSARSVHGVNSVFNARKHLITIIIPHKIYVLIHSTFLYTFDNLRYLYELG